ncbi:unnamed protein product [Echinostoma caproni]|uniref:Ubiquitin-like domain-containing protein n=1 Tax=Echinostoma caproni TaxID=27848 RepID=A0A183ANJ1_9TREM|nr:unnamed protein product [Echinostoma caproni]
MQSYERYVCMRGQRYGDLVDGWERQKIYVDTTTMLIFIRALAGTVIRLNVSHYETVEMVKTRISQQKVHHAGGGGGGGGGGGSGIPVNQQHLIFDGVELQNTTVLATVKISHGALLRLVLGVQSGPLNRETTPHTMGSAQPCHHHRSLLSTRHTICPLTVPVAQVHRIPTPAMVLPVLCTPNRVPSGHPQYKHPYHPQIQYLTTGQMSTTYPSNYLPVYPTKTDWDEPVSYSTTEFVMDDETMGSSDDATSELAEYLGYAIDEDELSYEHEERSTVTNGIPIPRSILENRYECTDPEDDEDRLSPDMTSYSSPSVSSSLSSSPSECGFVPVYPIASQVQWIVSSTDVSCDSPRSLGDQLMHIPIP